MRPIIPLSKTKLQSEDELDLLVSVLAWLE